MSKYTDACGDSAVNSNIVATGGIQKKGITGAYSELFWAADAFEFASPAAAKDQANWDAGVAAGNLIYLGKGKFTDQSAEAQYFEDQALDIREETVAATKVIRSESVICACSHAEVKKMSGKTGRLFIRTKNGYVIGRSMDDGAIRGRALSSIFVGNRSVPTTETPVEYTAIDFTFSDNEGDEKNPAEVKVDFLFSEVDQVYSAVATVGNESTNGTTLTAELTITKDCGSEVLTGIVAGNMKAYDEDGNALTIASMTYSAGVYTINITTALTLAYVSFTGIIDVASAGVLYYLDQVRISTT